MYIYPAAMGTGSPDYMAKAIGLAGRILDKMKQTEDFGEWGQEGLACWSRSWKHAAWGSALTAVRKSNAARSGGPFH